MTIYLFVTDPEYRPEKVVDNYSWSCSKTTVEGDLALVYVKGAGIKYEWRATSDAYPNDKWKYSCGVEHVKTFTRGITLDEIRRKFSFEEWAPPYQNFRGYRSIRIPPRVAKWILTKAPS